MSVRNLGLFFLISVFLSVSFAWAGPAPVKSAIAPAASIKELERTIAKNLVRETINAAQGLSQAELSSADVEGFVNSLSTEELDAVSLAIQSGDISEILDPVDPNQPQTSIKKLKDKICKFIHVNDPFWCGVTVGTVLVTVFK